MTTSLNFFVDPNNGRRLSLGLILFALQHSDKSKSRDHLIHKQQRPVAKVPCHLVLSASGCLRCSKHRIEGLQRTTSGEHDKNPRTQTGENNIKREMMKPDGKRSKLLNPNPSRPTSNTLKIILRNGSAGAGSKQDHCGSTFRRPPTATPFLQHRCSAV